jgi:putative ABC transport system permease protein
MPAAASTPEKRTAVLRLMREKLMALPGVRAVAAVSRLPLQGRNLGSWLFVEGQPMDGRPGEDVEYRVATPDYFAVMGVPLRAGRLFDDHDEANATVVLLINETAARRYFPGDNPIGKRVKLGATPGTAAWITIVGVVGDLRHAGLDAEIRPEIYRPFAMNPLGAPILVIRTAWDPAAMLNTLSATVRSVSHEAPAYDVYPMETLVRRSTAQRGFVMWLLSGFAGAALLLAGVGIYGTVSQSVVQRTQEIGVRMALGASPRQALWLVFADGLRLTAAGIAAGAITGAALTHLIGKLLFEVKPLDPIAFAAAALILTAFSTLACYIPASRATRVEPLAALRQEG